MISLVAINSGIFYYSLAVEVDDVCRPNLSTLVQEAYMISSHLPYTFATSYAYAFYGSVHHLKG